MLFEPTDTSFLRSVSIGKDQILVNTLDNIKGKITHFKKIGKNVIELEIQALRKLKNSINNFSEKQLPLAPSNVLSNRSINSSLDLFSSRGYNEIISFSFLPKDSQRMYCQKKERIVDKISLKIWNHLNDLILWVI
mgnify:CR=1 FL=1